VLVPHAIPDQHCDLLREFIVLISEKSSNHQGILIAFQRNHLNLEASQPLVPYAQQSDEEVS
jgi:hypothetical protein